MCVGPGIWKCYLSQDTIHAERVCRNVQFPHGCLCVFYTSCDKSKNPCTCGNHTHFPIRCITRTGKAQALLMHLVGKCMNPARAWVLAIVYCESHDKLGLIAFLICIHPGYLPHLVCNSKICSPVHPGDGCRYGYGWET